MMDKLPTMKVKGGNTDELYGGTESEGTEVNAANAGRLKMARSLEALWPGIVKTDWRFGRPQHVVDWSQFKTALEPIVDLAELEAEGPNEMGMRLRRRDEVITPVLARLAEQYEQRWGTWDEVRAAQKEETCS
jgi:hypothetical protein